MAETRYVYFANHNDGWISIRDHDCGGKLDDVKIGITINLTFRMRELHTRLIFAVPCEYRFAATLEYALHDQFRRYRVRGTEWFHRNPDLDYLITAVTAMGCWPWDGTRIIAGKVAV